MNEKLTIGQSLTPEQVRDLPDGAGVNLENRDGLAAKIKLDTKQNRDNVAHALGKVFWHSATLISLPTTEPVVKESLTTEPSPGEGYRWLVPKVDTIQRDDEVRSISGGFVLDKSCTGELCNVTNVFRRRIEPKETYRESLMVQCDLCKLVYLSGATHDCYQLAGSGPTPRVASEIEKRAALALAEMSVLDLRDVSQANGVEIMWTDVADACRDYLRAHDYARQIGAIE